MFRLIAFLFSMFSLGVAVRLGYIEEFGRSALAALISCFFASLLVPDFWIRTGHATGEFFTWISPKVGDRAVSFITRTMSIAMGMEGLSRAMMLDGFVTFCVGIYLGLYQPQICTEISGFTLCEMGKLVAFLGMVMLIIGGSVSKPSKKTFNRLNNTVGL